MMVIDCKGFQIDKYRIPPFQLMEGEIVTLNLFNGVHFFDLEHKLVSIFTGKMKIKNVLVYHDLMFAEHIKTNSWKNLFWPLTVGRYLKNNALPTEMLLSVFPDERLKAKAKIIHLPGNPRKFLSIYSVLSKCNGVIFDLVGNDPLGALLIYDIIEGFARTKNGFAILLNNFNDMKGRCEKHLDIELL